MHFTQTIHLTRDPDQKLVCFSIATSENRIDEITLEEHEFKRVALALWERRTEYEGGLVLRGKHKDGRFSLSVRTGTHTRTVYRLDEHQVLTVIGQYMAEVGGE